MESLLDAVAAPKGSSFAGSVETKEVQRGPVFLHDPFFVCSFVEAKEVHGPVFFRDDPKNKNKTKQVAWVWCSIGCTSTFGGNSNIVFRYICFTDPRRYGS